MPKSYTVTAPILDDHNATQKAIEALRTEKVTHLTLDLTAAYPNTQKLKLISITSHINQLLDSLQGNFEIDTIEVKYPSDAPDPSKVKGSWFFPRNRPRNYDGTAGGFFGAIISAIGGTLLWVLGTALAYVFGMSPPSIEMVIPQVGLGALAGFAWGLRATDREEKLYGKSKDCQIFNVDIAKLVRDKTTTLKKVSGLGLENVAHIDYNQTLADRVCRVLETTTTPKMLKDQLWDTYGNTAIGELIKIKAAPAPVEPSQVSPITTFLINKGAFAPQAAEPAGNVYQRQKFR